MDLGESRMVKIAFVSAIRNDQDILKYNLFYYYNIGIRDFYLLLHKSTLEQRQHLEEIRSCLPDCNFFVTGHDKDYQYHDEDIKVLTDKAMDDGFKWIIASDVDELIRLQKHNTIQDFISEYDHFETVSLLCEWYEHRPLKSCNKKENPFTVFNRRDIDKKEQTKAIGKFNDLMFYCPGVHLIHDCHNVVKIPFEDVYYSHFPDRNKNQFIEKYEIQLENWMHRYGKFPLEKAMKEDPNCLFKFWETKLVDENHGVLDQVNREMFEIEKI